MDLAARERHLHAIRGEIDEARAGALGRTGRKVEALLARCEELARSHAAAEDPAVAEQVRRAHHVARREAEHARWQLCVQREALGLHDHRWVDRVHPAPRPL